jgi:hypothetical protein
MSSFSLSVANLPAQKLAYNNRYSCCICNNNIEYISDAIYRVYLRNEKFIDMANSNPDVKVSSADPVIFIVFDAATSMGNKEWVFQAR